MAHRRGDNDRPEVLGHGFIEATTWGEGMSGDHNMHQKPRSYLDEHEPVAWLSEGGDVSRSKRYMDEMGFKCNPLYTAPPKAAEWVGLTDDEIQDLSYLSQKIDEGNAAWFDRLGFARAVEEKLKEKNHG